MTIDFMTRHYSCGKIGEHNAETVTVEIPTSMQHAGSTYRLAFLGVAALQPIRTHTLTVTNNTVTYSLPQSITSLVEADMALEEYNGEELLRKSPMVRITFDRSVPNGEAGVDNSTPVLNEITENTAARHTHSNKTVLDKFGESDGKPTYNGSSIGGATEWNSIENKPESYPPSSHTHAYSDITDPPEIPTVDVTDVQNEAGQSLVEDGIAVIPDESVVVLNFTMSGNGAVSELTAGEIITLANAGKILLARVAVMENFTMQLQIGQVAILENKYSLGVIAATDNGQAPICLFTQVNNSTDHFTISMA